MAREPRRTKLTDRAVRALPTPERGRTIWWDTDLKGFGVRVGANGRKTFLLSYSAGGVDRRMKIGDLGPAWSAASAREEAGRRRRQVDDGGDPLAERRREEQEEAVAIERTVGKVVERFLEEHASGKRSFDEIKRTFNRYVLPAWKDRDVGAIRRSDVAALLDDVAAGRVEGQRGGGAVQADHVLAWLTKLFNWFAARDDDFVPPVRRGMRRTTPRGIARDRVLTDDEIRALWEATEGSVYGHMVRAVLLTAQRPGTGQRPGAGEVSQMRRSEIDDDHVWTVPAERSKNGRALHVPLSPMAREVIDGVPRLQRPDGDGECDFVFTLNGRGPINGYSRAKRALDKRLTEVLERDEQPFRPWRVHDLRRTARTLMSRAGVPDRHAEMLLGHVVGGVEGVYNKHQYLEEKRRAADALATMVRTILAGGEAEVVPIRRGA